MIWCTSFVLWSNMVNWNHLFAFLHIFLFPPPLRSNWWVCQVALLVTGYDLHLMCGHAVPTQMAHSACTGWNCLKWLEEALRSRRGKSEWRSLFSSWVFLVGSSWKKHHRKKELRILFTDFIHHSLLRILFISETSLAAATCSCKQLEDFW